MRNLLYLKKEHNKHCEVTICVVAKPKKHLIIIKKEKYNYYK